MAKILIVDDNRQIISILSEYAKKEGYATVEALDGDEALTKFRQEAPDILLLDVMLPHTDGFTVCRKIREQSNVPIIMITARGEDFEKIMGLEIGADDYIVKPFSPGEVMARIKAILRRLRREEAQPKVFVWDNLTINWTEYTVTINNEPVSLTKKEFEMLWTLAAGKDKVFSRNELLNQVWGYDYFGDSRTVDSHIKRLRAKLEGYRHDTWDIRTIWGVGYKFEVAGHDKK